MRPAPASGTCEKLALLRDGVRNALRHWIARPSLIAGLAMASVSDRLEAEAVYCGRAQPFESSQMLRRAIALVVLKAVPGENQIPSLQRPIPSHLSQDRSGSDRK